MKIAILFAVLLSGSLQGQNTTTAPKIYRQADGVTMPKVVQEMKPDYPADVMADGIEGDVKLECVVNADGSVGDVRVMKFLDPQLDAAAINALKRWRFTPGSKDGVPVPVAVEVEMTFTFRPEGPLLDSPDVYVPGKEGVTWPKLVREAKPMYTRDARDARIEGIVELEIVIRTDGRVGDVRVTVPLERSLDNEAVRALRRWRFTPGLKDGQPVPTKVPIEVSFKLR